MLHAFNTHIKQKQNKQQKTALKVSMRQKNLAFLFFFLKKKTFLMIPLFQSIIPMVSLSEIWDLVDNLALLQRQPNDETLRVLLTETAFDFHLI